jgi:alpha-1,3-rhamnosyl/mannosyltransferase
LLGTARRIATVSEFSRRRLLAYVPEAEPRLRVTPLAAGPEFRPASADAVADARHRLGLPSGYVLAVGTLQPRKNIARLLDAWAALGERTDGLTLAVAGARSNPIFAPTELPALPPRTVLLGYVDDPDLPALYTGARAFVFPSLYEGFGLPVLEAMACGAPVIAANAGAPADLLADGAGVLVDPLDTRSIATGLAAVLEDDARRERLRAAGFERAATFSWERTAAETRELLRDALGSSTTGEA